MLEFSCIRMILFNIIYQQKERISFINFMATLVCISWVSFVNRLFAKSLAEFGGPVGKEEEVFKIQIFHNILNPFINY